MQTRAILLISLLFVYGHSVSQQAKSFYSFSQAEGLPNDVITCFYQDTQGFFWIGTVNGLSRYDGSHSYNFPQGPLSSRHMGGNLILDIEEDGEDMWVAHQFGATKINRFSFTCENFQTPDSGSPYLLRKAVKDIYKGPEGQIWLCNTSNLYQFDKKQSRIVRLATIQKEWVKESPNIIKIIQDQGGSLLLIVADGFFRFHTAGNKFDTVLHEEIPVTALKGQNIRIKSYWNSMAADLGINYHTDRRCITLLRNPPSGAVKQVKNIFVDDSLNLYINPENNQAIIWAKDGRQMNGMAVTHSSSKATPLQFNWIQKTEGNNWYAGNNGLLVPDRERNNILQFDFSQQAFESLNTRPEINHVTEYNESQWLVSTKNGLFLMDRASYTVQALLPRNNLSIRRAIAMPDKTIWYSTEDVLYHYQPATGKTSPPIHISTYAVAFHLLGKRLIVGTRSNGIVIIHTGDNQTTSLRENDLPKTILTDRVTAVERSGNPGEFLITYNDTSAFTVVNFETSLYRSVVIPALPPFGYWFSVHTIYPGRKKMWIGNNIGGISVYDSITEKWSSITAQDGLRSNNLFKITADHKGRIWALNSVGVDILDPATGSICRFPDALEAGAKIGMFTAANGKIVVYDRSKIMEVDADRFALYTPPKKVLIGQVMQDSVQLLNASRTISLPYNKNHCSVVFSVPGLEKRRASLYSYRLHSADAWTGNGSESTLSFGSLAPGKYELQIRATDEFGQWAYHSEPLTLIIRPPFWNTIPFYLLIAILVALVFYLFYRYRIHQIKRMMSDRERISRDLHDDIGATLSSLHIYGGLAQNAWDIQPEKSREMVGLFTQHSKDLIQQMGDVIWSLKTASGEAGSFELRLKNYSQNLLAAREIEVVFEIEDTPSAKMSNPLARKNLLLIAKEAMNNIAKYSSATAVEIKFFRLGTNAIFFIGDNGQGFDKAAMQPGNGLGNIAYRCRQLGGQCSIESKPGSGVAITCTVPAAILSQRN